MPKTPARFAPAVLVAGIAACGGVAPAHRDVAPPPAVDEGQLSGADGREICLMGRYGALSVDIQLGDGIPSARSCRRLDRSSGRPPWPRPAPVFEPESLKPNSMGEPTP